MAVTKVFVINNDNNNNNNIENLLQRPLIHAIADTQRRTQLTALPALFFF